MNDFNLPYFEKLKDDFKENLKKEIEFNKTLISSYKIILETIESFKYHKKITIKFFNALEEKGIRCWLYVDGPFKRILLQTKSESSRLVSSYEKPIEWQDLINACDIDRLQNMIQENEDMLLKMDHEISIVVEAANNLINVMKSTKIFKNRDYIIKKTIEEGLLI